MNLKNYTVFDLISVQHTAHFKNWAMKKCQGICSYKHIPQFISLDNKVTV